MDSEGNSNWPKTKKRKERKEHIVKKLKVAGKEHINHGGKHADPRTTGPDCSDIARRRPRKPDEQKRKDHSAAFVYRVRINGKDCPVCRRTFISLHGITKGRVCNIQQSLLTSGKLPKDQRGKHDNRHMKQARAGNIVCLSFNYMQNLPLPHLKTNADFYNRKLWHNGFGVHDLGRESVTMFTYHEGDGRKGSNEVTSMLLTYTNNKNEPLDNFVLISDSFCGQNKSQTMDFSLIDKKKRHIESVELPEEWDSIIQEARKKRSPFSVVNMRYRDFVNTKAATDDYIFKSPKLLLKIKSAHMLYITKKDFCLKKPMPAILDLPSLNKTHPPIAPVKKKDLQQLMPFLKLENRRFYEELISGVTKEVTRESPNATMWKFRVMITVVAVMSRKKTV
ncbi:hypothetical protein PR048_024919 [Dryococelus australis]|uniref:Uncharacterized protein n=1 Tax=Dryococelus australis TaxID=614101 RepID=A0ABQ9GPY8_9NEOP|nr:hypothetical protein PR048_024919 [Dryococelus australis]